MTLFTSIGISQKLIEMALGFLDGNTRTSIEVSWAPGLMEIEGNNRADEMAKEASELEPATEVTTVATHY